MKKQRNAFTLIELMTVMLIMGILVAVTLTLLEETSRTKTIKITTSRVEAYYDLGTLMPTRDLPSFEESGETLRLEFSGNDAWLEISGYKPEEHADIVISAKNLATRKEFGVVTEEELALFTGTPTREQTPDNKTLITLTR
jgi:prepilin-type N-terminal cleavage/methylation domain-containing protein